MSRSEYAKLVKKRKACQLCAGLTNPSEVDGGRFDSDQIGPWSRWQGNLSAELMVVGQDWGDTKYFRRHQGYDEDSNPTNRTLIRLIESIGITVEAPSCVTGRGVAFLTNAVLCLKDGGLQGSVQKTWFRNCAPFLRRQVEIVRPAAVVTLGFHALTAVRDAFGLPAKSLSDAVSDVDGDVLFGETRLFAVYHCGARVLNTHRPFDDQLRDWARVGKVLRTRRKQAGKE